MGKALNVDAIKIPFKIKFILLNKRHLGYVWWEERDGWKERGRVVKGEREFLVQ